jgi:hypothetical protein
MFGRRDFEGMQDLITATKLVTVIERRPELM